MGRVQRVIYKIVVLINKSSIEYRIGGQIQRIVDNVVEDSEGRLFSMYTLYNSQDELLLNIENCSVLISYCSPDQAEKYIKARGVTNETKRDDKH